MSESETVSIAPPPASSPDVLGTLTAGERSHWRLTGELPSTPAEARDSEPITAPESSDDAAESSPAQPDGQAASTDATPSPASEPGTSKKRNADSRKAELAAEIQTLLKQRDELRASLGSVPRPTAPIDVTPAPSASTQPVSVDQVIAQPDVTRPALSEAEFFEQFPGVEYGQYLRYVARHETRLFAYQQSQLQQVQAQERELASKAKDIPHEAMQKLPPQLIAASPISLMSQDAPANVWNYVAQELLESPDPAALVTHLADHPDDVQRIASTRNPQETIRTIAQITARLGSSMPTQPVVKTTTSAPAPVATLGSRASAPANEAQAAVAAGDFARYASAMNAREAQR